MNAEARYSNVSIAAYPIKDLKKLDFEHKNGACGKMFDDNILLCFNRCYMSTNSFDRAFCSNRLDRRTCRLSSNPLGNFTKLAQTTHAHFGSGISCSESKCDRFSDRNIIIFSSFLPCCWKRPDRLWS